MKNLYNKKDIRILWNVDEKGDVLELVVGEFKKPFFPESLYNRFQYNIGNSLCNWSEWTLSDVLINLFVQKKCHNPKLVVKELLKVKEWEDDLAYIKQHFDL